jgi:hypothetical protein
MGAFMRLFCLLVFLCSASFASALTSRELDVIGRRVWQNECAGTREGLTSWNTGENFASLGIGHFIWYPNGVKGPFEESFPLLIKFFLASGVKVPEWIKPGLACPWSTRAEFLAASKSEKMTRLRDFLANTVQWQARFLVLRSQQALQKMLVAAPSNQRGRIKSNYERVKSAPGGAFALIDYTNFKGEGTKETERYKGQGWGLLQVLANMSDSGKASPTALFAKSAEEVLIRRVHNAAPERREERWLPGWKSRVQAYSRGTDS